MLESTRTPLSQFGHSKTINEDKGYCFSDFSPKSSSNTKTLSKSRKLFFAPKFIAYTANKVISNEKESGSSNLNRFSMKLTGGIAGSIDKKAKKPIEVIEENPYAFEGVNAAESDSNIDQEQDQMVFMDLQAANSKNIFRQQKRDPNYSEYNMGPRFSNDGKVIKRSIIGKTDAFLKMQNILFKNTTEATLGNKDRKTSIMAKGVTLKEGKSGQINKSYTSLNSMSSINIEDGMEVKKKKAPHSSISAKKPDNEPGKFHFMTRIGKDELIQDIENAEQRQKNNNVNDQKLLEALPEQDKRFFTKEQRILDKFSKTQDIWDKKTLLIASKVHRKKESCVMAKTDEYRLKLENAQTLDLLKNDDEKYGNSYWYLTLRDYPNNNRPETNTIFKKSKMNFNKNNLEIVRKNIESGYKSPRKILTAYGPNEYLDATLQKNRKKLEIILPTDDDNFFSMKVFFILFFYKHFLRFRSLAIINLAAKRMYFAKKISTPGFISRKNL